MHYSDWEEIFGLSWAELWPWLGKASRAREAYFGRRVSLCVIINAKSGLCSEDCAFCSQAATSKTEVAKYPLLSKERLVDAARAAHAQGAARFSIVTSGKGVVSVREQGEILAAVAAIREAAPIRVCASLGLADRSFLEELQAAGLYRFHHNLETAASFYPRICSTHAYQDRVATIAAAKDAGLKVCVGGIFGLGETVAQRYEMAEAIKELGVDAIPLNFLHPLPGTRLADRPLLSPLEALKIIIAFRLMFPDKTIIICGGRQPTLRSLAPLVFAAGANALMTGDYLTTKGRLPEEDRHMLADIELELDIGEGDQGPTAPAPSPEPPPPTP
ncbi:MAG: biotin synthase BioB [Deltaproteobacteria bacterium]|nr:biotin synthase BioB [Deltaproteobacteria bacterium]